MNWNSLIDGHREVVDYIREQMAEAVDAVSENIGLAAGNKILICGNGGSACDARHMAGGGGIASSLPKVDPMLRLR